MKSLTAKLGLAVALAVVTGLNADALEITPDSGVLLTSRWVGNQTDTPSILVEVAAITGGATEQYTMNVEGLNPETGPLAGNYTTVFANEPGDPQEATITHDGGSSIGPIAYLLVKDGNQTPAWYLFDLTALGWNGTETLELSEFWPQQGAISHVSLFGPASTSVPDSGTTMALLGLGIGALGIARRKFA